MSDDAVVQEVRKVREEIFAEVGYDLRRLGERLRREDEADPARVLDLKPKRPKATKPRKPNEVEG